MDGLGTHTTLCRVTQSVCMLWCLYRYIYDVTYIYTRWGLPFEKLLLIISGLSTRSLSMQDLIICVAQLSHITRFNSYVFQTTRGRFRKLSERNWKEAFLLCLSKILTKIRYKLFIFVKDVLFLFSFLFLSSHNEMNNEQSSLNEVLPNGFILLSPQM